MHGQLYLAVSHTGGSRIHCLRIVKKLAVNKSDTTNTAIIA